MKCSVCEERAISSNPVLCKKHFDEFILKTVEETIERFELFDKKSRIIIGVSGGKDSLALADVLLRLGYDVSGLFIDEGIKNYREHSKEDLSFFSGKKNFSVIKKSFEDEFGFTLDEAISTKKYHACTICGTLRRYLLNKYSRGFDFVATGHNLDDESQTILMNLSRSNVDLFLRLGPKSEDSGFFTVRVKPFYFLTEKQILTYTLINNIRVEYGECPYAFTSYRANLRNELNKIEQKKSGSKKNIIETYLELKRIMKFKQKSEEIKNIMIDKKIENINSPLKKTNKCLLCGEASQKPICKTCVISSKIKNILKHKD